ncbi:PrsW family intramembrane metalloprotease [Planctomycetales bacterium ZRK34]|nr:PrsW family intramembrane metalloprotease [Planctomycetales bacterium ZRK34]
MKRKRPIRDSVFDEPQYRVGPFACDPAERTADTSPDAHDLADSVWAEPHQNLDASASRDPYPAWLIEHRDRTTWLTSWLATFGLALCAGPLAVLTAFMGSGQSVLMLLVVVVFAPACEEMAKVLAALMTVERRPYIFRNSAQILLCTATGGFVFACIENLIYLHIYVPNPPPALIFWRWTVCLALHTGCSTIAGLGVLRVWRDAMQNLRRPRPERCIPLWIIAVCIHGSYNFAAVTIEKLFDLFG